MFVRRALPKAPRSASTHASRVRQARSGVSARALRVAVFAAGADGPAAAAPEGTAAGCVAALALAAPAAPAFAGVGSLAWRAARVSRQSRRLTRHTYRVVRTRWHVGASVRLRHCFASCHSHRPNSPINRTTRANVSARGDPVLPYKFVVPATLPGLPTSYDVGMTAILCSV